MSETIFQKRRRTLAAFLITKVADAEEKQKVRKLRQYCFYDGVKDAKRPVIGLAKTQCGTSACALGWATTIWPSMMKLEHCSVVGKGKFTGYTNFALGAKFFGVSNNDAEGLFGAREASPVQKAAELLSAVDFVR